MNGKMVNSNILGPNWLTANVRSLVSGETSAVIGPLFGNVLNTRILTWIWREKKNGIIHRSGNLKLISIGQ